MMKFYWQTMSLLLLIHTPVIATTDDDHAIAMQVLAQLDNNKQSVSTPNCQQTIKQQPINV